MPRFLHTFPFSGNPSRLFEALRQYFHQNGFHLEEADAIALRLHAEKTRGLMSALFGLGTLHVFVSFPTPGAVLVRLSHDAPELVRRMRELVENLPDAPEKPQEPVSPPHIVVREIVRIPCRYCGSLVDNTAPRCPYCGGEIR